MLSKSSVSTLLVLSAILSIGLLNSVASAWPPPAGTISVVQNDDVLIYSGPHDTYYPFARVPKGSVVMVVGEKNKWARVQTAGPAFAQEVAYVRYRTADQNRLRIAADGKTAVTLDQVDVLAPNLNTGEATDSWKALVRIAPQKQLQILDTTRTDRETIHQVALPQEAIGWINVGDLRPAAREEVAFWNQWRRDNPEGSMALRQPAPRPTDQPVLARPEPPYPVVTAPAVSQTPQAETTRQQPEVDEAAKQEPPMARPVIESVRSPAVAANTSTQLEVPPSPAADRQEDAADSEPVSEPVMVPVTLPQTTPVDRHGHDIDMFVGQQDSEPTWESVADYEPATIETAEVILLEPEMTSEPMADATQIEEQPNLEPTPMAAPRFDEPLETEPTSSFQATASEPEVVVDDPPMPRQPTIASTIDVSQLELNDLEHAYEKLRGVDPLDAVAEAEALKSLYVMLGEQTTSDSVSRYTRTRVEQLTIWAELQTKRMELKNLRYRIDAAADETEAVRLALERGSEYSAVGRLVSSTIYDGQRLPQLYRLQDSGTGRTVAYVRPNPDLTPLLDQLIGLVGEKHYDDGVRLEIFEQINHVDLLSASSLRSR